MKKLTTNGFISTILLGTSGMKPLYNRYLTGLFTTVEGHGILIDCGEGMQMAFDKYAKMSKVDIILITHEHGDHTFGLPGFLSSLNNCSREEPVYIFAPESACSTISMFVKLAGHLNFNVVVRPIDEKKPTAFTTHFNKNLTIKTLPVKHSVPCIGYSIEYKRLPVFNPEKAKSLNIPVNYWKRLHSGETVTLEDGRTFTCADVTDGNRAPIKISYVTDTLPIREIAMFVANSDLYIGEGMYGDPNMQAEMKSKKHSLMGETCAIAMAANVKKLWLTHYSPAEMNPHIHAKYLNKIFPNVVISTDGETMEF